MAKSVRVDVAPGILKHFRESSGYTVDEVGAKLKMAPEDVKRLESGSATMTLAQLDKLSAAFKYPTALFFLDAPPEQKPVKDYRFLPDGRKTFDKTTLQAMRQSRHLQEISLELLQNLGRSAELKAKKMSLDNSPQEAAFKYRDLLKLTEDKQLKFRDAYAMFDYLRRALEAINVLVFKFSMPLEDARGFALADARPATVTVNSKDVVEARSFTLMHELGHVLLGDASVDAPEAGVGRNDRERWCDKFSSSLLLPDSIARRVFSEHEDPSSPETLAHISKRYKVSKAFLLYRLKSLSYISVAQYRKDRGEYSTHEDQRSPRRFKSNIPHQCVSKLGIAFVSLVADNLDGQHITYADASDYLSVKSKHIEDVFAKAQA